MILLDVTYDISNVVAAIIALFGVSITAIFSVKGVNREIYNKSVTAERIKWLNKVREDYSIIMAAFEINISGNSNQNEPRIDKNEYDRRMYEAEKARYDLISRLNTSTFDGNEFNYELKSILKKVNFASGDVNELKNKKETFMVYMNCMLEQEWQKSKKESERNE